MIGYAEGGEWLEAFLGVAGRRVLRRQRSVVATAASRTFPVLGATGAG